VTFLVGVCVCVRIIQGKRLGLSTRSSIHTILYGGRFACIDPEVKVKWTVQLGPWAVCCCCWRGTARRMTA